MKTTFLHAICVFLLTLGGFIAQSKAQVVYPLAAQVGNSWAYSGTNGSGLAPPITYANFTLRPDTTIGGFVYRNTPDMGYRSVGRKVYAYAFRRQNNNMPQSPIGLGYTSTNVPLGQDMLWIDFDLATVGTMQTQGFYAGFTLSSITTLFRVPPILKLL
jgi:hypothetical protein